MYLITLASLSCVLLILNHSLQTAAAAIKKNAYASPRKVSQPPPQFNNRELMDAFAASAANFTSGGFAMPAPLSFSPAVSLNLTDDATLAALIANYSQQQQDVVKDSGVLDAASVPPVKFLPPMEGITEQELFGTNDVMTLVRDFLPNDTMFNSVEPQVRDMVVNESVVELPPIEQNIIGETVVFDHMLPPVNQVRERVINKHINSYITQRRKVNIFNTEIHKHHKLINITDNLIANVERTIYPQLLLERNEVNQTVHQPIISIIKSYNEQLGNASATAPRVEQPVENVLSTQHTQLPTIFAKPQINVLYSGSAKK